MKDRPIVILAAGRGTRLAPWTDAVPKCLVPIGGSSPLALALDAIQAHAPAASVLLVVGHARERVEAFLADRPDGVRVESIYNPDYATTNNIVSAALARPQCEDGFLLANSDVVFEPSLLADALASPDETALVVDESRPIRNEAMKVAVAGERLAAIGKDLSADDASGEYIGLARFDPRGAAAFFSVIERMLERGRHGDWYEAAIGEAAKEVPIRLRFTRGRPWIEIDDAADLERAEREILPRLRPGPMKRLSESRARR